MTITTDWLDPEHTIARYEFVGEWTWAEFEEAVTAMNALLATVPHRVDVIIDFTQSPGEPPRSVLSHLRGGVLNAPANWGSGVFVGMSPFLRVLYNTFTRVEPTLSRRYALADTIEAAHALIAQRRAAAAEREK